MRSVSVVGDVLYDIVLASMHGFESVYIGLGWALKKWMTFLLFEFW